MDRPYLSLALLNYNEEETLERGARLCSEVLSRSVANHELLLVDDGSTDGSRAIIERLTGQLPNCRAILHPRNLGIGAGIRTCYFQSRGEWATWFPADMQADPRELPRLLSHLDDCDALITYRDPAKRADTPRRKFISSFERRLVRMLFKLDLRDLHWIRFYRRTLLDRMKLRSTSPFVDNEMVIAARLLGGRIRQVPLDDLPREFGVAKGAKLRNLIASFRDLLSLRVRTLLRAG
jgi:glycosyltransferase involved in cell wall biosynthesis